MNWLNTSINKLSLVGIQLPEKFEENFDPSSGVY